MPSMASFSSAHGRLRLCAVHAMSMAMPLLAEAQGGLVELQRLHGLFKRCRAAWSGLSMPSRNALAWAMNRVIPLLRGAPCQVQPDSTPQQRAERR